MTPEGLPVIQAKRAVCLIGLLAIVLILSGCWSRNELNDLAITVALGVDKTKDDEYEISVQIVDPGQIAKNGGGSRTSATLYSIRGTTIGEAIGRLTTITPRKAYFSHLRVLLISEELAREGISEVLEYISKNHEFRPDFYIGVARGTTAREILGLMTPIERIPANKMYNALEVAQREWAPVATIQMNDLIHDIITKGTNPVLTGFRIRGDIEQAKTQKNVERIETFGVIQAWGLAAFNEDKFVGWLDERESKGYTGITDKLYRSVLVGNCPGGGYITMNINRSKTSVKAKVRNGKPQIIVLIRAEGDISEVSCRIDLTKPETIKQINKVLGVAIKENMERSLRKAKKLKTDIFGFGEAIHRVNPSYWRKVMDDWDQHFTKLPVVIQVEIQVRQLGTTTNPIRNKLRQ